MGLFSNLQTWMAGGDTSSDYKKAKQKYEEAEQTIKERAANKKTTAEIQREGRAAAGQAAADKAGVAKQQAMGAARMGGAGRLQSAIAGSGAAQQAATEGYSETANQMAGVEAGRESQLDQMAQAQAANLRAEGDLQTNQAENAANRRQATLTGATQVAAAALLSDGKTKEYKKHRYIPKEER